MCEAGTPDKLVIAMYSAMAMARRRGVFWFAPSQATLIGCQEGELGCDQVLVAEEIGLGSVTYPAVKTKKA
jgi:hypothetical protein